MADLTETVQSLNSRYFYREKELDNLISRLAVKNLTSSHPPLHSISHGIHMDLNSNSLSMLLGNDHKSNGVSALPQGQGDFGALSPTTALYLLGESADDLLLMNQ